MQPITTLAIQLILSFISLLFCLSEEALSPKDLDNKNGVGKKVRNIFLKNQKAIHKRVPGNSQHLASKFKFEFEHGSNDIQIESSLFQVLSSFFFSSNQTRI